MVLDCIDSLSLLSFLLKLFKSIKPFVEQVVIKYMYIVLLSNMVTQVKCYFVYCNLHIHDNNEHQQA